MSIGRLYGDESTGLDALGKGIVLTESSLLAIQERHRRLTDDELLSMICPTGKIQ